MVCDIGIERQLAEKRKAELKEELRRLNRFLGGFRDGVPKGHARSLAFCPCCRTVGARHAFRELSTTRLCARCARQIKEAINGS